MTKKQKKVEPKRIPTRRELSKWQKQRKVQRITMGAGALFIALVIGFVGYGFYSSEVMPLHQPAIRVNGTVFDMGYLVEMLSIYAKSQGTANLGSMVDVAVKITQQNELIRQGALKLGVSVGVKEVNEEINRRKLPRDRVYRDMLGAELLVKKLHDGYFEAKIPTSGEQVHVQAIFLESEDAAKKIIAKLGSGGDFVSLAKEFSQEGVTRTKGGDLGWLPQGLSNILVKSTILEKVAFSLKPGELSKPTYDAAITKGAGYWLIEVTEDKVVEGDRMVHARAILLGTKEEAKDVRAKLEAGEDFTKLAQELSQHSESKDKGGDLGWLDFGLMHDAFDKVAFKLKNGVISEPVEDKTVQTSGGYWLVKVLEKDNNRQLEAEARRVLKEEALNNWMKEQKDRATLEDYLDEVKKAWAVVQAAKGKQGRR